MSGNTVTAAGIPKLLAHRLHAHGLVKRLLHRRDFGELRLALLTRLTEALDALFLLHLINLRLHRHSPLLDFVHEEIAHGLRPLW